MFNNIMYVLVPRSLKSEKELLHGGYKAEIQNMLLRLMSESDSNSTLCPIARGCSFQR